MNNLRDVGEVLEDAILAALTDLKASYRDRYSVEEYAKVCEAREGFDRAVVMYAAYLYDNGQVDLDDVCLEVRALDDLTERMNKRSDSAVQS